MTESGYRREVLKREQKTKKSCFPNKKITLPHCFSLVDLLQVDTKFIKHKQKTYLYSKSIYPARCSQLFWTTYYGAPRLKANAFKVKKSFSCHTHSVACFWRSVHRKDCNLLKCPANKLKTNETQLAFALRMDRGRKVKKKKCASWILTNTLNSICKFFGTWIFSFKALLWLIQPSSDSPLCLADYNNRVKKKCTKFPGVWWPHLSINNFISRQVLKSSCLICSKSLNRQ